MRVFARQALLATGWAEDVAIEIEGGIVTGIALGLSNSTDGKALAILPGMANLHSHAFQRGMAGLTEYRTSHSDSFWTWRDAMYRFVDRMDPDDCRAIAELAYIEMLESGFTRVAEFHYLHHDVEGRPYGNPAEMGTQIVEAARATGIGLTLLPVLYSYGGFGSVLADHGQRRFINDVDGFAQIVARSRKAVATLPGANLGIAPHSLRAVDKAGLGAAITLAGSDPIHMHIAEQVREVEDCVGWSGQRPVEWLLDNAEVDRRWCLIHATHITDDEGRRLAGTGAVAGLCPITESNLGDGTFEAEAWTSAGGALGFGTDSNVAIGLAEEVRQLEYSVRLQQQRRNVLATETSSTGRTLFEAGVFGGARATQSRSVLEVGGRADFVVLDLQHPTLVGRFGDRILDAWMFGRSPGVVASVYVAGEEVVREGRHVRREAVEQAYSARLPRLLL